MKAMGRKIICSSCGNKGFNFEGVLCILEEQGPSEIERSFTASLKKKEKVYIKTSMLGFPFGSIIYWQINVFLL